MVSVNLSMSSLLLGSLNYCVDKFLVINNSCWVWPHLDPMGIGKSTG